MNKSTGAGRPSVLPASRVRFEEWLGHLSPPSGTSPTARARVALLAVAATGYAFLLMPRPTGLVADHLHKEDGMIFLTDFLRDGIGSVFAIYSGYLHVGARLVAGFCMVAVPAEGFSGCIAASTAGIRVLATVLAFWVFLPFARSWPWALAAAAGAFLFLPNGQQEILGNITNLRWILVAATATALLGNFERPLQILTAAAFALIGPLSDPLCLVLAPLALVRFITVRGSARVVPLVYTLAAIVQFAMMRTGDRAVPPDASVFASPADSIAQLIVRGVTVAQYGLLGTEGLLMVGGLWLAIIASVLPVATVISALRMNSQDRRLVSFLLLWCSLGLGLLLVTFLFADMRALALVDWWAPASASRYSALTGFFLTPAIVLASASLLKSGIFGLRGLAVVTLVVLVLAVVADFRGDPWNTRGPIWAATVGKARAQCQLERHDQTVPITPQGVPMPWTATVTCDWLDGPN